VPFPLQAAFSNLVSVYDNSNFHGASGAVYQVNAYASLVATYDAASASAACSLCRAYPVSTLGGEGTTSPFLD